MDRETYEAHLIQLFTLGGLLIEVAERAETIGPYLDPTLWRDRGRDLQMNLRVLHAFRRLQLALGRELGATATVDEGDDAARVAAARVSA